MLAGVLGTLAAHWLRARTYRRVDDEVLRTLTPWAVPVISVLAAAAGGSLGGLPALVLGTYVVALVWAVMLAVIDLEVLRLPDVLVLPAYPVLAVLLGG